MRSLLVCLRMLIPLLFAPLLLAPRAYALDPFWAMFREDDIPFEPTVAVGPQSIIEAANFRMTAYDRSGENELWRVRLNTGESTEFSPDYFWFYPDNPEEPLPGTGGGDVRVLYDQFAQRFIVISMSAQDHVDFPPALYLAVSKTSAPATHDQASWDKFYMLVATGDPSVMFHFPGLAVSQERIYVSAVVEGLEDTEHVIEILQRPPPEYDRDYYLLPGNHWEAKVDPTAVPGVETATDRLPMPAHFLGAMPAETMYLVQLVSLGDYPDDDAQLRFIAVTFPAGEPALTYHTLYLTLSDPGEVLSVTQLCPGDPYVQWHWNIQNVVWKQHRLYFTRVHARSEGYSECGTGPRRFVGHWYVVRTQNWPHGALDPVLQDDGVIDGGRVFINDDPDDDRPVHVIYPLVMPMPGPADEGLAPELAVFFSRYHSYGYVDLCWTARRGSDDPHSLGAPVSLMMAGSAGVRDPTHWGDYEGIALDPLDTTRVWATGETGRCTDETPCEQCDPLDPDAGQYQHFFHSAIGSYTVPYAYPQTLTVQADLGGGPAVDCHIIKIMPADTDGDADAEVAAGAAERKYGYGTLVTLRAPELPSYTFDCWNIERGYDHPPHCWTTDRAVTITMDTLTTATARYIWTGEWPRILEELRCLGRC